MFNSHSLIRCWIAGALVCAAFPVISGNAQRAFPRAAATTTETDELFDAGELHDIWIHINARDWEQLRTAYRENTYYPADIEWRGVKVRNAGIRVRGRTSRTPHKPALRIDFNRYVAGQEFLGLKSLALDNLWQDASMIRERLAMQIFRRMGLQAPRESHARVYVGGTREFAGVYGVVEVIDKDFLQRTLERTTVSCTSTNGRSLTASSLYARISSGMRRDFHRRRTKQPQRRPCSRLFASSSKRSTTPPKLGSKKSYSRT